MSFAGEMKDFRDAYEQGTRIALNRANTQKVQMNMPLQPGSDPGGSGSFVPGAGAGIGTANAPQASTGGYSPTKEDIAAWTDYIGEGAAKRGMDPAIAIKVAQSEGLAPGVWQSRLPSPGGGPGQEASFGPFQMYTGGGLGNSFQRDTGLDPSDPKNVLKTIDYALDHAKQNGWGAWHGWKGDPWAGINRSGRSDASPYTYTPTSGTPVAAAGVDQTKTAGIPDDEEQAAEAPAEEDAVTAENPEITVLPVQKASLVNPRVVMEEDQVGGRYARGGVVGYWKGGRASENVEEVPVPYWEQFLRSIGRGETSSANDFKYLEERQRIGAESARQAAEARMAYPQEDLAPQGDGPLSDTARTSIDAMDKIQQDQYLERYNNARPDYWWMLKEGRKPEGFARGGAIPDDSTNFAGGGLNDVAGLYSGVQNTNAQATPIRTGSTGTNSGVNQPRRITFAQPDQTWRTWGGATPSQTKFRTPAVTPAAQTAQPAAAAPSNAITWNANPTGVQTKIAQVKNQLYGSPWESSDHQTGHQKSQLRTLNSLKAVNKQRNSGTNHAGGGMVSYAEGGPVPDFNEWKRRETRMSGRAEEAGQGARDQAARRMNMRERGIDSTAYKDPSTKFPPRPSPFKTPPPSRSGGGRPMTGGDGPQPGPAPDWAFAPAYEPGDTGPRPSSTTEGQRTQPLLGTPATPDSMRPDHFSVGGTENVPAEPEATVQVPSGIYGSLDEDLRRAGLGPGQDGTPSPQTSSGSPSPYMYHARGGAIPDDDSSSPMRSDRASSSNLGPKKAKARARTDPWEGLRTKESKPVRKPSKKGGREAAKRAKPKSQRPDDAGAPVPTPRPDPTTGQAPPIPTPRPTTGGGAAPTPTPRPTTGAPTPTPRPTPILRQPSTGVTQPSPAPLRQPSTGVTQPSPRPVRQIPGFEQPAASTPGSPPSAGDRGPPTDFLKLGRSTIADFLDMLSPEDLSRPIEDLANLNVQGGGPQAGGAPPVNARPPPFQDRTRMPPSLQRQMSGAPDASMMRRGGAIPDDGR